jgi:hypothetical protein
MLTDMPNSVCRKHLSVLKETSYNPSPHFSLDNNPAALVGARELEFGPKMSIDHIAEGGQNVIKESMNPANVSKLEIAAFKRVMWQSQETSEAGPKKASKEPKEFTADIPENSGDPFGTTNEEDDGSEEDDGLSTILEEEPYSSFEERRRLDQIDRS